jgi:hypothetical protein
MFSVRRVFWFKPLIAGYVSKLLSNVAFYDLSGILLKSDGGMC